MANIVLAHGAWSAAWAWKKMRPLFAAAGHTFYSPSYTGLGERAHLARPDIDLSTHIQDVLNVLEFEDLKDVVLLGHSYGGMVAMAHAARYPGAVSKLVLIVTAAHGGFVPRAEAYIAARGNDDQKRAGEGVSEARGSVNAGGRREG